jgi:uncharacterized iron-regulated membrane protein
VQRIYMPANDSDPTYVRLVSRASSVTREIYVDQYSGRGDAGAGAGSVEVLGQKELANQLIWKIHEWHLNLGAGVAGGRIVFYVSIGLLGLAISGLYLWWHRRIFALRAGRLFSQTNYDLHRTLGFWSGVAMALFCRHGHQPAFANRRRSVRHDGSQGGASEFAGPRSYGRWHAAGGGGSHSRCASDAHLFLGRQAAGAGPDAFPRRSHSGGTERGHARSPDRARSHRREQPHGPVLYTALVQWNREIHIGVIFGLPSQIIASVISSLLGVPALSGTWIWLNRKLAAARGRRVAARRPPQAAPAAQRVRML